METSDAFCDDWKLWEEKQFGLERGKDIGGWKWKELWQFCPSRSLLSSRATLVFNLLNCSGHWLKPNLNRETGNVTNLHCVKDQSDCVWVWEALCEARDTFELFILRERTEKFVMASISPTTRGLKQFGGSFGTEKRNRGKTCQAERERGSRADYVFRIANMRDGLKAASLKVD